MKMYAAIYMRYYVQEFNEWETLEEAINFLNTGNDEGFLLPIAIVNTKTKGIEWKANNFPNQERESIQKFIKEHLTE